MTDGDSEDAKTTPQYVCASHDKENKRITITADETTMDVLCALLVIGYGHMSNNNALQSYAHCLLSGLGIEANERAIAIIMQVSPINRARSGQTMP